MRSLEMEKLGNLEKSLDWQNMRKILKTWQKWENDTNEWGHVFGILQICITLLNHTIQDIDKVDKMCSIILFRTSFTIFGGPVTHTTLEKALSICMNNQVNLTYKFQVISTGRYSLNKFFQFLKSKI